MKPFEGDDADLGGWEESYHKVVPFISGLVEDNYLMRPKPDLLPALSILRRNQNATSRTPQIYPYKLRQLKLLQLHFTKCHVKSFDLQFCFSRERSKTHDNTR